MRGRLNVGEVELGHLPDGLEDRAQLLAEALDFLLRQLEPRKGGHMKDFFSCDCHQLNPSTSQKVRQHFLRQRRRAPFGARSFGSERFLDGLYVHRLQALVALLDVELNTLSLCQRPIAVHRDLGVVDEDVLATLTLDEAVPLLVRKPFDGALCQRNSFLQQTNDGPGTEPPTSIKRGRTLASDPWERKKTAPVPGRLDRVPQEH